MSMLLDYSRKITAQSLLADRPSVRYNLKYWQRRKMLTDTSTPVSPDTLFC
jgi:hypothetical protein